MRRVRGCLIVSLNLLLWGGCGAAADDAAEGCARAVAHINACAGSTVAAAPAECDPEAAAQLLALPCEALQKGLAEQKADGPGNVFAAAACAAGLLRHCPKVACNGARYPEFSSTCIDYLRAPGCGGCQFYSCREAKAAPACGPRGYYLGYGGKYCERFLTVTYPRLSPAGQRFLDTVRDCLIRFVDGQLPTTAQCSDVKTRAFDSHVRCYLDSGFCQTPITDRLLVLNTVELADIDYSAALRTGVGCLSQ